MGESDRVFQGEAGEPTVVMVRNEGARIMASVLIIMASCTYNVMKCISLFINWVIYFICNICHEVLLFVR